MTRNNIIPPPNRPNGCHSRFGLAFARKSSVYLNTGWVHKMLRPRVDLIKSITIRALGIFVVN